VLDEVEKRNDPLFTRQVFEQVLLEIAKRLNTVQVIYSIPKRVSLQQTISLIENFLSVQSGGDRVLAATSALLETIGKCFNLFTVKRANINASDASSGMVADIECIDGQGKVVLAVEVKDKELTVNHIKDKLPGLRAGRISEILFIAQKGINQDEIEGVITLLGREFSSGQNIYVFNLIRFTESLLALIGENGRRDFLETVGTHLDKYGSALQHRKTWAALLSKI